MNYLKKALQASYKVVRTSDPDGEEIRIVPPIRNGRDMAAALDMPKSTLFRWIDNPAARQFTDEQLQILHNQLYWRQTDLEGNQVLHIKQTKDLLQRDLEADQTEERGRFGSGVEEWKSLSTELRGAIRKVINDEIDSAVKRSLEESTARVNILTEQLRVKEELLAEVNAKLTSHEARINEMQDNLDFARMVADRFSEISEQQQVLIEKLAS